MQRRSATPSRPMPISRPRDTVTGRPTRSTRSGGTTLSSTTTERPSPAARGPSRFSGKSATATVRRPPGTATDTPTTPSETATKRSRATSAPWSCTERWATGSTRPTPSSTSATPTTPPATSTTHTPPGDAPSPFSTTSATLRPPRCVHDSSPTAAPTCRCDRWMPDPIPVRAAGGLTVLVLDERRVSVTAQKPKAADPIAEVRDGVAGLLGGPLGRRMGRDAEDLHPPGGNLHHDQHAQPAQADRVDVEEVRREQSGCLGFAGTCPSWCLGATSRIPGPRSGTTAEQACTRSCASAAKHQLTLCVTVSAPDRVQTCRRELLDRTLIWNQRLSIPRNRRDFFVRILRFSDLER